MSFCEDHDDGWQGVLSRKDGFSGLSESMHNNKHGPAGGCTLAPPQPRVTCALELGGQCHASSGKLTISGYTLARGQAVTFNSPTSCIPPSSLRQVQQHSTNCPLPMSLSVQFTMFTLDPQRDTASLCILNTCKSGQSLDNWYASQYHFALYLYHLV